jgi:hypothetical protein
MVTLGEWVSAETGRTWVRAGFGAGGAFVDGLAA